MMNDPMDNQVSRIHDGNLQFAHIGTPSSSECRLKRLPCEIVEMCGVDDILPSFSLDSGPQGSRIRCREHEPSFRLKRIRQILKFLPRFAEVFDDIPHRHDVEFGVVMRLPQVTETRVGFQAGGLASFLSSISISLDTHGADAVFTRDLTQSAHTAAEIKQALTCKRPQFSFRFVDCLPPTLFGCIFVCSDTRIT